MNSQNMNVREGRGRLRGGLGHGGGNGGAACGTHGTHGAPHRCAGRHRWLPHGAVEQEDALAGGQECHDPLGGGVPRNSSCTVASEDMVADIVTKAIAGVAFYRLRARVLGLPT